MTRFSATEENIQDLTTGFYTSLRTNITLVSITKEDNDTQIGCTATDTDSLIGIVEKSDTLILASPPSQPTIQLTSILSNCTVRLKWTYPTQSTLPLTQQITDSVTNSIIPVQGQNFLSDFLTAGENISYTLSAVNCIGDSVTAVSEVFPPPSQPKSYSCTADYGTENGVLVLEIPNYDFNYTIQTGYIITDDTDDAIELSGDFSVDNPFYYSQGMMEFNSTRNYTVLFTSVLRDCVGSVSTSCQVKLNIVAVVTTTPSPTTTTTTTTTTNTTTTTTTSPSATPPGLAPYTIYIVVAIILFLLLLFLSCIIILLACILGRGKLSRSKYVPKNAERLPNPASTPENHPESDPNVEELHYITPDFSINSTKPKSPIPKTLYSDISEMPVATEAMSSL